MPLRNWISLLLTHPTDVKLLVQFWIHHRRNQRDITEISQWEHTGYERLAMRRCWELLDQTGPTLASVIKQLEGPLARTVCLFYLVLRGLDTIEDDMTIPDAAKQPLLRSFHEKTVTPGWTFHGNGPDEKDRQLLVEYDVVVQEINLLDGPTRAIIVDICQKMQTGMADYAHTAATSGSVYVETIKDYELYAHYVSGLVGEGVSRLFSATGMESPFIATRLDLANSMGLFLQKANITRDFREDADEGRFFWPREIWGSDDLGGPAFKEMAEMYEEGRQPQALWVLSAMVVDALQHAEECLEYLSLINNQSVFNFCAFPQVMAIATQELLFMNPLVFCQSVKIRKAQAAELVMRATSMQNVCNIFREYARKIRQKASPHDPSFFELGVACEKIERWYQLHYPADLHVSCLSGIRLTNVSEKMQPEKTMLKFEHKSCDTMMFVATAIVEMTLLVGLACLAMNVRKSVV